MALSFHRISPLGAQRRWSPAILRWLACLLPLAFQLGSTGAAAQMQIVPDQGWADCWSQVQGFYSSAQAVCDVRGAGLGIPLTYVPKTSTAGDCKTAAGVDYGDSVFASYCLVGWLARNFGDNWMCAPVPPGTTASAYSTPANAYCQRSSGTDPDKSAGECKTHTCNPINISTGNKFQRELDYQGSGPQPLQFVRYYNSAWPDSRTNVASQGVNAFRLGRNWQHNYDLFVRLTSNGTLSTARVRRPDGKQLYFALSAGAWVPEADISDKLERLFDTGGTPIGWRYTTSEDQVETYDADGKLVSLRARSGLTQTLSYDGSGRLASVTDAWGRQLIFAYDASNRISTSPTPTDRSTPSPTPPTIG